MTTEKPTRFDHLTRDPDDGTREGGLGFLVGFLGLFVAGAALFPSGLTLFWVWVAIISGSMASGTVTMRLAQWNNTRTPKRKSRT
ncbi:MAG: hypothetical protein AAGP08_18480 [Pseudomonadota bacterium]